jgi:hypothetical protein
MTPLCTILNQTDGRISKCMFLLKGDVALIETPFSSYDTITSMSKLHCSAKDEPIPAL